MYDPSQIERLTPGEMHARREEIIRTIAALPRSYDDAPTELLEEMAFIAGALRRKTSGPPRVAKITKRGTPPKTSIDDIVGLLDL